MKKWLSLLLFGVALPAGALTLRLNENPIFDKPPQFVREVPNGRLELVGEGDDAIQIAQVWGTPYEMGFAAGTLLKKEISAYLENVISLMVEKLGGDPELIDRVYELSHPYIPEHYMEEMQGLAKGSDQEFKALMRANLIGETSEWHCSLFGAWGAATASTQSLLQLRALDYSVDAEIQRFPVITVYHPDEGHAFANIGWSGMIGAVTGMSSSQLAISEIGDDYDAENDTFEGVPFAFLLRDILQFDNTLDEAVARLQKSPRTTSLMYAVGDGKKGEARSFQTSHTLCNVFNPDNLEPVTPTHPRIKDIVYWGMSWNVPQYDGPLSEMLKKHYGKLTPEITIREILPTVRTGSLQVAIYDLTHMILYTANARAKDEKGPLNAYERQFIKLDMKKLFGEKEPKI